MVLSCDGFISYLETMLLPRRRCKRGVGAVQSCSPLVEVKACAFRRVSGNAVKRWSAPSAVPFCVKDALFHFCMAPKAQLTCLL